MKLRFEEAHRIARQVAINKGGTFRVFENEHGAVVDTPPTGFVVGGAGYCAQREAPFGVDDLIDTLEFCNGNQFGLWLDEHTGRWYLDEVTIHASRVDALLEAGFRSQIAIWDLESQTEIRL